MSTNDRDSETHRCLLCGLLGAEQIGNDQCSIGRGKLPSRTEDNDRHIMLPRKRWRVEILPITDAAHEELNRINNWRDVELRQDLMNVKDDGTPPIGTPTFHVWFEEWCEKNHTHYYARPRESFSMPEAILEAAAAGRVFLVVEDLS